MTSENRTGGNTVCVLVKDLAIAAKLTYYVAKTLKVLEGLPLPPPP